MTPRFTENEIFVKDDGKRYLVLAVGEEAYFIRQLDVPKNGPEPRETAWGFEGAEAGVARHVPPPSLTAWGGYTHHADRAFNE